MRIALASVLPLAKWVMAVVLDLYTAFVASGYLVGFATGVVTEDAIALSPIGAAVTFVLIVGYFAAFTWFGGTPWQRVLGLRDAAITN